MIDTDNSPIFSYKDYIGEYFDVPIGEPFYYETYDIVSNNKATFKLVKTPNKHKSCNYCPLIKHFCGGIECYCIAKKSLLSYE